MTFRLDGDIQDRCDTAQSSLMSSDHLKGKAWRVRICFSVFPTLKSTEDFLT